MSEGSDHGQKQLSELTETSFLPTIRGPGIVLVDCWAPWCKACKDFQPVFEAVAMRNPSVTFAKLNTQREQGLVKELGLEHVPSLLLFRDGLMLFNQAGYYDKHELEDIIAQAESLDMHEVRAAIAADAAASGEAGQEGVAEQPVV